MQVSEGWGADVQGSGGRQSAFVHVAPGLELRFVVSCDVPVRYEGHWEGVGIRPCPGEGCSLCAAGVGKQQRWVIAVLVFDTWRPAVWEFGQGVARGFQQQGLTGVSLRGLGFRIYKLGRDRRSATAFELDGEVSDRAVLAFGLTSTGTADLPPGLSAPDVLREWWKSQGWV